MFLQLVQEGSMVTVVELLLRMLSLNSLAIDVI